MGNPTAQLSYLAELLQSSNDSCLVYSESLRHFSRSSEWLPFDCAAQQIQIHHSCRLRPLLVFEIVVVGLESLEPIAYCVLGGDFLGIYSGQLTVGLGWFGAREEEK